MNACNKPINLRLKDKFYKRDNFFSYKVGCDICEHGNYIRICTNYYEQTKDGKLDLNELCIVTKNFWDYYNDREIRALYVCFKKPYHKYLYQLYRTIKTDGMHTNGYEFTRHDIVKKIYRGTTSAFSLNQDIEYVVICCSCLQYIRLSKNRWNFSNFIKINPLRIFWRDVLLECFDNFIFENDDDARYVKNLIALGDLHYQCDEKNTILHNNYKNFFQARNIIVLLLSAVLIYSVSIAVL